MKIEDKHTGIELSRRMHDLGWDYEAEKYWLISKLDKKDIRIILIDSPKDDYRYENMEYYPAPDAAEIMEKLHEGLRDDCSKYNVNVFMTKFEEVDKKWIIGNAHPLAKGDWYAYGKSETECLGKLWCYLKEKKLL